MAGHLLQHNRVRTSFTKRLPGLCADGRCEEIEIYLDFIQMEEWSDAYQFDFVLTKKQIFQSRKSTNQKSKEKNCKKTLI